MARFFFPFSQYVLCFLIGLTIGFTPSTDSREVHAQGYYENIDHWSPGWWDPWWQFDPPPMPDEQPGCVNWQWVGIMAVTDYSCPNVDEWVGWTAQKLFPTHDLTPLFDRYCLYTNERPDFDPVHYDQLYNLVRDGHLTSLTRNCMVVGPMGGNLNPTERSLWRHHANEFARGVGQIESLPLPLDTGDPVSPAHLIVFDSVVTRTADQAPELQVGPSHHGRTLVNLAKSLVCNQHSPSYCAAELETQLALPWLTVDSQSFELSNYNDTTGGHFGSLVDLALALSAANSRLRDAQESLDMNIEELPHRWYYNLSLAWDSLYGGTEAVYLMAPPVRAIYEKLEEAACLGAGVIAAAGNDIFAPASQPGPLYPGAWESAPAPMADVCSETYGVDNSLFAWIHNGGYSSRPLVYAAAGVGADDRLIDNAAPRALPPRVAYAEFGTVISASYSEPSVYLTGSSVASLATASAATAVSAFDPWMSIHEVMEHLWTRANPISGSPTADFCLNDQNCPVVKRINLCWAVQEICEAGSRWCPAPWYNDWTQTWVFPFDCYDAPPNAIAEPSGYVELTGGGECIDTECPDYGYDNASATPWIVPQPDPFECLTCHARLRGDTSAEVYFWIPSNVFVLSAMLINGTYRHRLGVNLSGSYDGGTKLMVRLPKGKISAAHKTSIRFVAQYPNYLQPKVHIVPIGTFEY